MSQLDAAPKFYFCARCAWWKALDMVEDEYTVTVRLVKIDKR